MQTLPVELIDQICNFLDIHSLISITHSYKAVYAYTSANNNFWQQHCKQLNIMNMRQFNTWKKCALYYANIAIKQALVMARQLKKEC